MVLDKINKVNDIKDIPKEEYDELADEIRNFLIEVISKNGGHLASNLGVVELTMALHLALDLPEDKIFLFWRTSPTVMVGRYQNTYNEINEKYIKENNIKKGDVISVARIAGIMGAKQTSNLIPLCHNINIEKVSIDFILEDDGIIAMSYCRCSYKTGIEMEALTAVSISLLTIWDMCKAVDKKMKIGDIVLISKTKENIL